MNRMLLVVSDGTSARFFGTRGLGLHYVHRIEHTESRAPVLELFNGGGAAGGDDGWPAMSHRFAPHADPCDLEAVRFARRIAAFLDDEVSRGMVREIALMMPPRLLGMVRASVSPATAVAVTVCLDQHLVDLTIDELNRRLAEAQGAEPRMLH